MSFFHEVLDPPSYGFQRDGKLYIPTTREILKEFFSRLNFLKSKKNWLPFLSWFFTLALAVPLFIFVFYFFSWKLLFVGMFYSLAVLATHATIYYHRYSTHKAYQFKNSFWRFICRNLVIKLIPEEIYVVSHHVHHRMSEKPGDPYNVHAGWLYCFLADVIHQPIAKNLSEKAYRQTSQLLQHTGIRMNSYEKYLKWGSICHPVFSYLHFALNWLFWYSVFYLIGGHALATAIFGLSIIWAVGIRTFNYDGHGGGKNKQRDGIDFHRKDLSINQSWSGYLGGEWHNNHHLYPRGARSGFLNYQMDVPWLFIKSLSWIGGVSSYHDFKKEFLRDYYSPYLENQKKEKETYKILPGKIIPEKI